MIQILKIYETTCEKGSRGDGYLGIPVQEECDLALSISIICEAWRGGSSMRHVHNA